MIHKNSISVCLASYNGEKFIKEQIESILPQLDKDDEIVVSDDHSTDMTISILKSFNDSRIKIFVNNLGKGVIKNFENAILNASHDLVFLCDQDDIWRQDKVFIMLKQFEDKDVTLVLSNALYCDENGKSLNSQFFDKPVPEKSQIKHFIKPLFLGCAIAFKKNSVPKVFPIPENIPMHDWWIGALHMYYGKVKFINEDLIYYRRHDSNVTSRKKSKLSRIIRWRIIIFVELLRRTLKN
ncbi:glycosyltransferase family 2 protein [Chryseobacterium sp. Leaf394]|uniref:glycosyltransferase family 2 protein n=1 Tax=Chryseobacterium sp. Leaf394 TaxID=1736361 RepID=UPI0006FE0ED2|nr:glycosyltransferase family 2 protein [Chryseobacterium sp. Leaf394]KQS93198.1 hypothetical protein ASG21_12465 [Chryseobacterium sp. Leaf394]